jgi:hypothetical protein
MCISGVFFKFGKEVGVELSIVNGLYRLRITDQLFKSYAFTRVVRSQSTLQRLLRRQILKNILYLYIQGVSEIRVLILTRGRTRQIMELFSITFLRKSNTN